MQRQCNLQQSGGTRSTLGVADHGFYCAKSNRAWDCAGRLEDHQQLFARGLFVPFAVRGDDGQQAVDRRLEITGRGLGQASWCVSYGERLYFDQAVAERSAS